MTIKERIAIWVAWKIPRWLALWCFVRVSSEAITKQPESETFPELTCIDASRFWSQ